MITPAERLRRAIEWRVNVALDPIRERADRTAHELGEALVEIDVLRRDVDRLIPQVAALETRLADLRTADSLPADDADAIAREHERVRIKLEAISHYEERLRRLEGALAGADRAEVR